MPTYLCEKYLEAKRLGGYGIGGETTRVCGAKRLGLKIEAKRLGETTRGKWLGGETSCFGDYGSRFKIQEILFKVGILVYNIITLDMGYFVDKQDKKAVHVYKY